MISPALVGLLAVAAVLVYVPLVMEVGDEARFLRSGPTQQEARQAPDAAEKIRSRLADGSPECASTLGVLFDHDRPPGQSGHVMPPAGTSHSAVSAGDSHIPRGSVCG